jgi:prepilin-type N-terminal cleavage/methylation domain-containing protein
MSTIVRQPQARFPRQSRRAGRRGFTLIEAAMATVIIGVAFTAMLQLLAAGTVANRESTDLTTAINLANNIHEAAMRMPYDDLFDLEGPHNPAVDSRLQNLNGMPGWSQVVDVRYVDHSRLTLPVPDTQLEPTTRITVSVQRHGKEIYKMSWISAASG